MISSNKTKILVVDDSESNRLLLSFILQELGFEIDTAENGEKAVEMALEYDYAAIFMDLNMPVMSGTEAVNILRGINYQPPLFACSAEDNPDKIESLISSGFNEFTHKPVAPEDIREILQKYNIVENSPSPVSDKALQQKLDQLSIRFINNIPVIIKKTSKALETQSIEDLKRIAHKLKGTASQFGFEKITKIGRDIELAINKDKISIALDKAPFLISELKRIVEKHEH